MSDNVVNNIFKHLQSKDLAKFKIEVLNLAINNHIRDGKLAGEDKKILIEWCEELLRCLKEYDEEKT